MQSREKQRNAAEEDTVSRVISIVAKYYVEGMPFAYLVDRDKPNPVTAVLCNTHKLFLYYHERNDIRGINVSKNCIELIVSEKFPPMLVIIDIEKKNAYIVSPYFEDSGKKGNSDITEHPIHGENGLVDIFSRIHGCSKIVLRYIIGEKLRIEDIEEIIVPLMKVVPEKQVFDQLLLVYGSIVYAIENKLTIIYADYNLSLPDLSGKNKEMLRRADKYKSYPKYIIASDGTVFTIPEPLRNSYYDEENQLLYYSPRREIPEIIRKRLEELGLPGLPVVIGLYV
ncbi:MAG: hypothetical protein GXO26_08750 [Crenarchaeota archaeon]|nr:hypothetical protein [Thermoproteota archaeon]